MPNPNLADVGKRPGGFARDAAAKRDAGNRETVTLMPAEVKAVQRALGAKSRGRFGFARSWNDRRCEGCCEGRSRVPPARLEESLKDKS